MLIVPCTLRWPCAWLQAKASSGASAVVAVISLRTNRLQAVSVGGGMCVVAHTSGSFKQALTEALAVADGRKAR